MKKYRDRATTTDALIVKDNKILLIKRDINPSKGSWALPGGYVSFFESTEQACKREVKEETGMSVKKLRLLGVYSDPKRDPRRTVTIAYIVTASGKAKAGDDAADARWFPLSKLPNLAFDHAQIMGLQKTQDNVK
jgi:8-oxo-dGTP diphosphatase